VHAGDLLAADFVGWHAVWLARLLTSEATQQTHGRIRAARDSMVA